MFGLRKTIRALTDRVKGLEHRLMLFESVNVDALKPKMDEYVRERIREILDEELVLRQLCAHEPSSKTILAVETHLSQLRTGCFGDFLEVDSYYAHVARAKTHHDEFEDATGEASVRVYVRRCTVCGSVSPVSAFDVAAAGSHIAIRNIADIDELIKKPAVDTASLGYSELDALLMNGNSPYTSRTAL